MTESEAVIWRDGELIPYDEATIHVLSHAAHRGSEVFDVLRVLHTPSGPAAVGLRPHVARFDRSMDLIGMEAPYEIGTLEEAVADTVARTPGASIVKLVAAWSEESPGTIPVSRTPTVFVAAIDAGSGTSEMPDPVSVQTATMPKIPAAILPPALKVAASYTAAIRHQMAAQEAGFDDVIFRSIDGGLAEATTQSLLMVRDRALIGPTLDTVLDSITRRMLFDLAQHDGIAVDARDIGWDEVQSADELILNSTNYFVRPVGQLDDRKLDAPGPVANGLAAAVDRLVDGTHPLHQRWLTPLPG